MTESKKINDISLLDLLPKYVIGYRDEREIFDINNMIEKLNVQTGLDIDKCKDVVDAVVLKIINDKKEEISKSNIRKLICTELKMRGFEREASIFDHDTERFYLDDDFIKKYKGKQPKWDALGYVVYKRTYSRLTKE